MAIKEKSNDIKNKNEIKREDLMHEYREYDVAVHQSSVNGGIPGAWAYSLGGRNIVVNPQGQINIEFTPEQQRRIYQTTGFARSCLALSHLELVALTLAAA